MALNTGVERRIVARIVNGCTKQGWTLEVWDEEGPRGERTTSGRAILDNLGLSDEEAVAVYDGDRWIGQFNIMNGEGADIIFDYRASGKLKSIIEEAMDYGDGFSGNPDDDEDDDGGPIDTAPDDYDDDDD